MNIDQIKEWIKKDDMKSSANIVGSNLILSLPDAKEPCVWRTDLQSVQSAIFSIVEKDGLFTLTMKDGNKNVVKIASYTQKDDAKEAFNLVSETLIHGKSDGNDKLGFWRGFVIFLAVFIVMYVVLTALTSEPKNSNTAQVNNINQVDNSRQVGVAEDVPEGVPVLLDDVLGAP